MPSWIEQKLWSSWPAGSSERLRSAATLDSHEITSVRAGVIKTSVSRPSFSHLELKGLKVVARAHLETGIPITSHNSGSIRHELEGGNIGMEMLDLLEREGLDPKVVIVGHTDENVDIRNLFRLAERGSWIQFDTIGKEHYLLDETRANLALTFIEKDLTDEDIKKGDRGETVDALEEEIGINIDLETSSLFSLYECVHSTP